MAVALCPQCFMDLLHHLLGFSLTTFFGILVSLLVSFYFGLTKSSPQLQNGEGPHQVLDGKVSMHQFFKLQKGAFDMFSSSSPNTWITVGKKYILQWSPCF